MRRFTFWWVMLACVAACILGWWLYVTPTGGIVIERLDKDQDEYTRGQIHYLSMDAGMTSCWNQTVKKLLHLACPRMSNNPELEVELAFILTSCFCMSIGAPHLTCRSPSPRDTEEHYHFSLIECATGRCFNKYDMDGFEITHDRIPDVCYYILYEAQANSKEMNSYIGDSELGTLKKVVSGEHFGQYDTKLQELHRIVSEEFKKRQEGVMFWLKEKIDKFWLILDDVKFKLRVGNYANVPYY